MTHIQIAIDGPSGSGKSTLAKSVSRILGILYLDTGAMYRACGLKAIQLGISPKDETLVGNMLESLSIDIRFVDGEQRVFLDGMDVSDDIRTPAVSVAASDISGLPAVRSKMVAMQRSIAGTRSVVLDGRDIGSHVLPDAKYKFFLTADPGERASRRLEELALRGIHTQTYEEVLRDILYRDQQDSTRSFAPLTKMADAIEIDTTHNSQEDTLHELMKHLPGDLSLPGQSKEDT
jgi:cytidylate kinase